MRVSPSWRPSTPFKKHAGDDRRITADAAFVDGASTPHAVGVWESWSPNYTASPTRSAPDYAQENDQRFRRWLVSSPDPLELASLDWIKRHSWTGQVSGYITCRAMATADQQHT